MARKAKGAPFQLKSGNSTTFKMMGSTPYKQFDPANLGTLGLHQATASTTGTGQPIIPVIEEGYTPPTQQQIIKFSEKQQQKTKKKKTSLSEMPFGSQQRIDEYKRRGWAMDDTTHPKEIDTKKVDKIEGGDKTKIKKAKGDKLSGRSREETKLTKFVKEKVLKKGTGPGGKKIQKGWVNPLFRGKNYKGPKDKYATEKPAPTKDYKRGYYGA